QSARCGTLISPPTRRRKARQSAVSYTTPMDTIGMEAHLSLNRFSEADCAELPHGRKPAHRRAAGAAKHHRLP
ncbi:hypothetical protein, partial [Rhizobium sp. Root1203]|uniref:hypothetical protein n=1 Tax=Rhizobium sp. Root1203 TaxID=1736427 RepID=UPI001AECED2F